MDSIVYYVCDGKACGESCPNDMCHHTKDARHALHKDGGAFDVRLNDAGDTVLVVEKFDG